MLKTVRDAMVSLACLLLIIMALNLYLNPQMVAEWKIQVDDAYWTLYEKNCADRCIGD